MNGTQAIDFYGENYKSLDMKQVMRTQTKVTIVWRRRSPCWLQNPKGGLSRSFLKPWKLGSNCLILVHTNVDDELRNKPKNIMENENK